MKRYYGLFVISAVFVFALLSGCASISRSTGFTLREREGNFGVQEPWHNLVLKGDMSAVKEITVAYVPLPIPRPWQWWRDIDVRSGLKRRVFRAIVYRGESFAGVFDAVL